MISEEKRQFLVNFAQSLSKDELIWGSGYFYGLSVDNNSSKSVVKIEQNISILYITETGNSKFFSAELGKKLKNSGAKVKIKAVEQYRFTDLPKEKNLIIIASTHGEGEMPDAGKKFFDYIQTDLNLSQINFAVIALGDTNYPLFCQAGVDIDRILAEKKAKRLIEVSKLDLDFEDYIPKISDKMISVFSGTEIAISEKPTAKKTNQYKGTIVNNINLNDVGSDKETRHIEIEVEDELFYEPGDAIGIVPKVVNGEKATPRLYSIASSLGEHGNEVHITVSVVRYKDKNGEVKGLVSNYLAEFEIGQEIDFYVSKNRNFKLPDDDKSVIMVGPGTGVAPFRSFVAERNYRGARGKNWLFFGDRSLQNDFLYQAEWLDYLDSGILTHLDVAFSRDQEEKTYVQHRLLEKGVEIFKWLEDGAVFYVCGDKEHMAVDVEEALLNVIKNYGLFNTENAKEYLKKMTDEGRYLKDVY